MSAYSAARLRIPLRSNREFDYSIKLARRLRILLRRKLEATMSNGTLIAMTLGYEDPIDRQEVRTR